MKIRYDPEVDALSIIFRETTVQTRELAEGIAGEYDAQGRLVGIEILDAAKRLGDASALREVTLEGLGATVPAAVKP
jgi:YD repeat-containing protein